MVTLIYLCCVFKSIFACLFVSFTTILTKQMELTFYLCMRCQQILSGSLKLPESSQLRRAIDGPQNFSANLACFFTSCGFWFRNLNIIKWESSSLFFLCHFSCDLILCNWNKLCLISCSIIARQPQAMETQHSVSIKQFSVIQDIFFLIEMNEPGWN